MKIEDVTNYGKGLVELSTDPGFIKTKKQIMMLVAKSLLREIGMLQMVKLMWQVNKEKKRMKARDWPNIEKRGFDKGNLGVVREDVANMKVLAHMFGDDKACLLFSKILNETDDKLAAQEPKGNLLLLPVHEFKACDDPFIAFKEFIKASEEEMVKEGSHEIEIIQDTNHTLAYNVNYCLAHEVAKESGNPIFGIPWCQIDDIALPKIGADIGFKYARPGSLCSGKPKCDFRFERVPPAA